MVSTIGHDQQRGICLRLRDVLYPRDAVALSSLNREVRGSTQALLPHSRVSAAKKPCPIQLDPVPLNWTHWTVT